MSIANLTGTENQRFQEIQKRWLVFCPISNEEFSINNHLYTVPLGQNIEPNMILNSGSYDLISGSVSIEKIIHQFDDETEAVKFLTDFGVDNIVSYIEKIETSTLYENSTNIEIQIINYPILQFSLDFDDLLVKNGYKIEVFQSGSIEEGGMRKISSDVVLDNRGNLISDTYLKYFAIKSDRE